MDEFALIQETLAPLTEGAPEAFGLRDDAALLRPPEGGEVVVTTDAVVEGVHVLPATPLDAFAHKALAVNLSDLAAKGARPFAYTLAVAWPRAPSREDAQTFAAGLKALQERAGARLIGGDTVRAEGAMMVSITAFGAVARGAMIRRAGAKVGDAVYVTGPIGDAGLGLEVARGRLETLAPRHRDWLRARYLRPEPRVDLIDRLAGCARAALDVSDGLFADAGRLAAACGAGVEITLADVPLSEAARSWLEGEGDREAAALALAAMGDDYEIVFAMPADAPAPSWARCVGVLTAEPGVRARAASGVLRPVARAGFTHF